MEDDYNLSSIATTVVNETKDSPFQVDARINVTDINHTEMDDCCEDAEEYLDNDLVYVNVVQNPYRTSGQNVQNPYRTNNKFGNRPRPQQNNNNRSRPPQTRKPYDTIRNTRQKFSNRESNGPLYAKQQQKPFARHNHVVCDACGKYGHDHMKCALTAMVLHIFEWAKTHKEVIPLI